MKSKEPKLGNTRPFGCQTQVYTERGWVTCDNYKEVQEEFNRIRSLNDTNKKVS